MPSNPSRRARIAAIAATADYNPEEAAVAQAMLERLPEHRLETLAENIKAEWGRGIDVEFRVGELLHEARAMFTFGPNYRARPDKTSTPSGVDEKGYGAWLAAQHFPFSGSTAYNLRIGYERKDEVLAFLEARSQSLASRPMGVNTAVALMAAKPKAPASIPLAETTPTDPAYASLRDARVAILRVVDGEPTGNAFEYMHVDDLRESGLILKALLDAYNETRSARA